ncbi:hypothetical protein Sjap_024007 [Stephania japonica]|uniref:Uncharacterized protein n=1 Tax=Stephania japonica TaxID=461633 RepID=A0AAP0EER2_9MAGN
MASMIGGEEGRAALAEKETGRGGEGRPGRSVMASMFGGEEGRTALAKKGDRKRRRRKIGERSATLRGRNQGRIFSGLFTRNLRNGIRDENLHASIT